MKLATIAFGASTSAAVVEGANIAAVRRLPGRDDALDVAAVIGRPLTSVELRLLEQTEPVDHAQLLAPILHPPKNILCVGRNYLEHVREGARAEGRPDDAPPDVPIWFSKPATALVGDGGHIVFDSSFTAALDYEGELAVVIGSSARKVAPSQALQHVFGYSVLNDVTARDVQHRHKQWLRGKGADSYAPFGPWITTADEIADPQALEIVTIVNGEVRQRDSTAHMIFDIPALISDISTSMTLQPGDVIATGTPAGVAWGMAEPRYLQPGDEVSVEISHIGRLSNTVVSA